ncbi:MAG: hypothetical protein R6U13_07350 [Desulfatiglandaceae bacterium]
MKNSRYRFFILKSPDYDYDNDNRFADKDLTSKRIKAATGVSMREIHRREGASCERLQ